MQRTVFDQSLPEPPPLNAPAQTPNASPSDEKPAPVEPAPQAAPPAAPATQ
jgi:hypothetical protein